MKNLVLSLRRIYYAFINPFRYLYWFLFRPHTRGAKCIVEYKGKILFVRLSYSHKGWTLPGGKVKRGESFLEAARRETFEETGIVLDSLVKVGEYVSRVEYKVDTVEVFYSQAANEFFKVDGFEILEARWAFPEDLPKPHPDRLPSVLNFLQDFKKGQLSHH